MKVSVAMATYNGERYIEEQLASIAAQTHPVDEVVICDDGSTDGTLAAAQAFIRQNNLQRQWTAEQNPRNLGYASNFIRALRKTTGDIVFFCDQDDRWTPDRVALMAEILRGNPDVLLMGSEFSPFVSGRNAPSVPRSATARFRDDGSLEKLTLNKKTIFIGAEGCSMCVRRSFFDRVAPYWYEGWAHDEFLWKLALCLDGCYFYHRVTLARRLHDENVTMGKMRDRAKRVQFLEQLCKSHEATLALALDVGLDPRRLRLIRRNIIATKLRIDLLAHGRLGAAIPLAVCYPDCYHSKKSIPVELMMAIKKGGRS